MMRFLFVIFTCFYFNLLTVLEISAQTSLLVLPPYSTQNEFRRSEHPRCKKLYLVDEKVKTYIEDLENSGQFAKLREIYQKSIELQNEIESKCQHPTDVAIKNSFDQDVIRKLKIELSRNEKNMKIFNYQSSKELEDQNPEKKMMIDVENYLEKIWLLYEVKDIHRIEKKTDENSTVNPEENDIFSVLEVVPANMVKDVSSIVEANKKIVDIKYYFKDLQNSIINTKGEFKTILNSSSNEYERLELLFAHYYRINKTSPSTANLETHVFFVDYTQNDQNNLPTVYNRKSRPTSFKNRTTDYIGNMTKDLSIVIDEFAKDRRGSGE